MKLNRRVRIRGNDPRVQKRLLEVCEQIVRATNPQKIVLFGSYAYGEPSEDSDLDLLVIMPFEGHPAYQAARIRMQIQSAMPLDLLVRTPEAIAERIARGDFFMQEVMEQGKVIYEADHTGVDKQGRKRLGQRAA
jgi:predicted nucleotidyltransferase